MDPFAHRRWYPFTTPAITQLSFDSTTGTHIPFRAKTNHVHHTWARTFYSYPELYLQPESERELQLIVNVARQCHKKIMVVGSGHSPSELTCSAGWMVNLDGMREVVAVDEEGLKIVVQAGIRLWQLQEELDRRGMAMPNLGSIMEQSIAGAISTCTHGSSLRHGLLSQSVLGLRILLSDGRYVECSEYTNPDLFAAALASLGGLGIITQVSFQAVPAFKLSWRQEVLLLDSVVQQWESIWRTSEFARVWWFPYSERAIYWQAKRTDEPLKQRPKSWYGGWLGRNLYEFALYVSTWFPKLTPVVERWVFRMQYGWEEHTTGTAVEKSADALTMDCLFSQYVNEWAIPLHKGPEFITRFQTWLLSALDPSLHAASRIPFSSAGIFVHAPIEVRISDTSISHTPRPWLDQSVPDGPTLYINATLYRPYLAEQPARERYYEAFEWLMKEMGGKPHWAKNWHTVTPSDLESMYPRLHDWALLRNRLDPVGMFRSEFLEQRVLPILPSSSGSEEKEEGEGEGEGEKTDEESGAAGLSDSDKEFVGSSMVSSVESFDMMRASEAEIFRMGSESVENLENL